MTLATWLRKLVREHPSYAGDSVVTPEINCDVIEHCLAVGEGTLSAPELFGDLPVHHQQPMA